MRIVLHKVADLTKVEKEGLKSLTSAVYPPELMADWPGKSIEWASPQWCVVCWNDREQALSHVGLVLRDGFADDEPVAIGGVGSVKTHPDARNQGLASQLIERGMAFFLEQDIDFALLVCEPGLVPYYERLDWHTHSGSLVVRQQGEACPFTFNLPMTRSVRSWTPDSGVIDLAGPPW